MNSVLKVSKLLCMSLCLYIYKDILMVDFIIPIVLYHTTLRDSIVGQFQTFRNHLFGSCYMLDTVAELNTHSPCSNGV